MKRSGICALSVLFVACWGAPRQAVSASVVLVDDEWPLSDVGFLNAPDAGAFATNIASWFAGGGTGRFHAYSTDRGVAESALANAMTNAGHTWTTGLGITFDLPTLMGYDGIFLSRNPADIDVLIEYVNAGGNVYLAGGAQFATHAAGQAAQWNPFLNEFGLALASSYNGLINSPVGGNAPISGTHFILDGVAELFHSNGQDAVDMWPTDPRTSIVASFQGHGLVAVYDSTIPEPSSLCMLVIGAVIASAAARRRRRKQ